MKLTQIISQPVGGCYKCNEYTTEYGTIILDGSETGGISHCNIFQISFGRGLIQHYCRKDTGVLQSIWLVGLLDQNIRYNPDIRYNPVKPFCTPVFDTSAWKHLLDEDEYSLSNPLWPTIVEERQIAFDHNGRDTFLLAYGVMDQEVFLNENISFLFDQDKNLQGIKVFSPTYVPEMLARLERSTNRDADPVRIEPPGTENTDESPRF